MPSIVKIVKSQSMLGSRNYLEENPLLSTMYLFFFNRDISSKTILEFPCSVSVGDLGYKFGTPENSHDPIHLGFAATQTKNASMNSQQIAEQIHCFYNGSTDIDSIFLDLFPDKSGEIILHEELDGVKIKICNKQWYGFSPVGKELQSELKKEYSSIAGKELLPF